LPQNERFPADANHDSGTSVAAAKKHATVEIIEGAHQKIFHTPRNNK
jgi:hypothetical protein